MEKEIKEALYYLGREIARNRAYIGALRNEGTYVDLVDSEIDEITANLADKFGDDFIK